MNALARTARRGLGIAVFAGGNLAALAMLIQAQPLGRWLAQ